MQPSHLPPGVLEEHFDVGGWGPANYRDYGMDIDDPNAPERSQIGPGVMARRWLTRLHPHPLLRPVINSLPVPQTPKSPNRRQSSGPGALATDGSASASSSAAPPAEPPVPTPLMTLDELYESLPGGKENHDEWFFCPECWGWYRVVRDDVFDPEYPSMPDWEKTAAASYEDKSQFQAAYSERQAEVNRFRSISESRQGSSSALHFHPFRTLMTPTTENRIERVQIDGHVDKFAHLELDEDPERYKLGEYSDAATLWANCLSNKWVFVDKGPVPGQLSHKLVRDFTEEKLSNPGIGQLPADSAMEAWRLVTTYVLLAELPLTGNRLLQNALFRANRGWVKMSNPTFQAKIGASLTS